MRWKEVQFELKKKKVINKLKVEDIGTNETPKGKYEIIDCLGNQDLKIDNGKQEDSKKEPSSPSVRLAEKLKSNIRFWEW